MLAAIYSNAHRAKDADPATIEDYLVFGKTSEPDEQQDVDAQLRHIAFMFQP